MNILSSGLTDIGLKRKVNEDFFIMIDHASGIYKTRELGQLFAVADGMGGHTAGDIAGKMACETILDYYDYDRGPPAGSDGADAVRARLESLFVKAHDRIVSYSEENIDNDIMGTTLSVLLFLDDKAYITHIGDSRIYLMRKDRLVRMTKDDTGVQLLVDAGNLTAEQAAKHPMRHILVQALGVDIDEIYTRSETVCAGDQFLLCSDGLYDTVPEHDIERILSVEGTPEVKCRELLDTALKNGGKDNITEIVIQIIK